MVGGAESEALTQRNPQFRTCSLGWENIEKTRKKLLGKFRSNSTDQPDHAKEKNERGRKDKQN